jgi:VanZ family protein
MAVLPAVLKRFWPAVAWGVGILVLTGIPGQDIPRLPRFVLAPDKIAHLLIFAGFSFLLVKGFSSETGVITQRMSGMTLLISSLFGAMTEILQATVFINRMGSVADFLVDLVGNMAGLLVFHYWKGNFKKSG